MPVIDASTLTTVIADDGQDGDLARARVHGQQLSAPEVIDLEVTSALRRLHANGALDARRVGLALQDLWDIPLRRASHRPLLRRCWELRDNLTPYDAAYVALAELSETTLLTTDARLARAPGITCAVEVLR